ncbi:MAG: histidine kinase [Carboxylicivirga sp.]|jgi:two-component sensor histidine kinase|nr:histidine kinase [Carboxylicivirga sp.]
MPILVSGDGQLVFILLFIINYTEVSSQSNDLHPKIKKGDTWNMVFETDGDFKINTQDWYGGLQDNSKDRIEWKVVCEEQKQDFFRLKFTLLRWEAFYDNRLGIAYNDTDYPAELTAKFLSETESQVGKSIVFSCSFGENIYVKVDTTELRNNENRWMNIPRASILDKLIGFGYSSKISFDRSRAIGDPLIQHFLATWLKIINHNISDGLDQVEKELNGPDCFDINYSLLNKTIVLAKISQNKSSKGHLLYDKRSKVPLEYIFGQGGIKVISYGYKQSNTTIALEIAPAIFNQKSKLEILYPISSSQTIKLKAPGSILKLDLKEPVFAILRIGDKIKHLMIRPYMDVEIKVDDMDSDLFIKGEGSADMQCVAEINNKIPQNYVRGKVFNENEIDSVINKMNHFSKTIINKYGNKLSNDCKQFIKTDNYYAIGCRLIEIYGLANRAMNHWDPASTDTLGYFNCIKKINEIIKTYNVLGKNSALLCPSYHDFLNRNLELSYNVFLNTRGRSIGDENLDKNLLFASMYYQGYPYYFTYAHLLKNALLKCKDNTDSKIKEFRQFPCHSNLKTMLDSVQAKMSPLSAGNSFPYLTVEDENGDKHKINGEGFTFVKFMPGYIPICESTWKQMRILQNEYPQINQINFKILLPHSQRKFVQKETPPEGISIEYIYIDSEKQSYFDEVVIPDEYFERIFLLNENGIILRSNLWWLSLNSSHGLHETFKNYFESLNRPKPEADNRRLWLFLLVGAFGSWLLGWGFFKLRTRQIKKREESKRRLSEMELKAIRSQMNPHFIFNAMGSIQNLINHNNITNANLYLSRYARLMRMVLSSSNKKLVTLSDEIELLEHYLKLEQLRVSFHFEIACKDEVDPEMEEVPGMLLQPFVENAVIHGITPKGKGQIDITFGKNQGVLKCEIADDGVGIKASQNGNGNGLAMKMSQKRLELLNRDMEDKMSLQMVDRTITESSPGTKVILSIPVE